MADNIFPDAPFYANVIDNTAHAYSPDGTRDWGIIPATHRNNIKIIGKGVLYLVGEPLWSNGKQWRVLPKNLGLASPEPPPEPPTPTPDRAVFEWLNDAGDVITTENWKKDG